MRTASIALMIVLLISIGSTAAAHHSAAGQDFTKRVEMEGVVKSWQIMNPHGKLVIQVTDAKGAREIELETHSRNNVYRAGYRDGMINAGDKIKVYIAPNRDGSDGGYLVAINNALYVSGKEYMQSLENLCKDGYLSIRELIPIPEDFIGYNRVGKPITDPAPFNHSTKTAILDVRRKQ